MRLAPSSSYFEERDAISHDWGRLFNRLGIDPVLVPNSLAEPERLIDRFTPAGILLTGGDDIGGGPADPARQTARDRTEFRLLDKAVASGLPVFGVCRGLQVMNAYFGGELRRSLDERHAGTSHRIRLLSSLGGRTKGDEVDVNSYHNHGVHMSGLAPGLQPLAVSAAGIVEAFANTHGAAAIQWHPERDSPDRRFSENVMQEWIAQCS